MSDSRALKYQKLTQKNGYCTNCYKNKLYTKWLCLGCRNEKNKGRRKKQGVS